MTVVTSLLSGAAIGILLALLGCGRSILTVPALIYLVDLVFEEAVPTSLVVIAAACAVAALPKVRAGHVQWRLAGVFAATGVAATFLGAAVGTHLSQSTLLIGFAAVMIARRPGRHRNRLHRGRFPDQLAAMC